MLGYQTVKVSALNMRGIQVFNGRGGGGSPLGPIFGYVHAGQSTGISRGGGNHSQGLRAREISAQFFIQIMQAFCKLNYFMGTWSGMSESSWFAFS